MFTGSYSEFQPLEEVIVGRAYDPEDVQNLTDPEVRYMLARILEETEEDILVLVEFLESIGVRVRRPNKLFDLEVERYDNGQWRPRVDLHLFGWCYPTHPLMPRDTAGVYGDSIVEFFTKTTSRYFENWSCQDVFMEYYRDGANWYSMPMPILGGNPTDQWNPGYEEIDKILFHAANILKCGKDLFYTGVRPEYGSGKGTQWGIEWIKRNLGDRFNIHPINAGGHADGKMALLRPGVVMCWDPRVLPDKLFGWDVVVAPDTAGRFPEEFRTIRKRRFHKEFVSKYLKDFIGYCDETVFDVNCFSVNENLVITNGYDPDVAQRLANLDIEVWPWHFRHQWFWDGAVHCLTLDTKRRGGQEDYFR